MAARGDLAAAIFDQQVVGAERLEEGLDVTPRHLCIELVRVAQALDEP